VNLRVGAALYSFGFPPNPVATGGAPLATDFEGYSEGPRRLQLKNGAVLQGHSGSPILDLGSGVVCGMVTWTRGAVHIGGEVGFITDLGGRGETARTIFDCFPEMEASNSRFHEQDSRWKERMPSPESFVLGRLADVFATGGMRLVPAQEIRRLEALVGASRTDTLGLLRDILQKDIDPHQLERFLVDAYEQLRLTRTELDQLRQLTEEMPDIATPLAAAERALALSDNDAIDLGAAESSLREAREAYSSRDKARQLLAAENIAKLLEVEGSLALARSRPEDAAALFGLAAHNLPKNMSERRWRLEFRRASALLSAAKRHPEAHLLQQVVSLLRETVLPLAPRAVRPFDWAMTLNNLGNALVALGEREAGSGYFEAAVAAYRDALKERTRDRVPPDWAMTQNNLGNAFLAWGEREGGAEQLEEAVAAFRAALGEYARDSVPLDWAMTQNNLGNALLVLGERQASSTNLADAIVAYRGALKERTRGRDPLGWAMTQNNLGNALLTLGERESSPAHLEEAVAAYRDALEERTRDRDPLDWATTQNNLGEALLALGEREVGSGQIQLSIDAFRDALKESTRERVPLDWAMTQNNLGNALRVLGERELSTAYLEEAVRVCRDALDEYTRDRVPLGWASTKNNLGNALRALGEQQGDSAHLEEAVAAFRDALEENTRDRVPLEWAITQNNLGRALRALGERDWAWNASWKPSPPTARRSWSCALTILPTATTSLSVTWTPSSRRLGNAAVSSEVPHLGAKRGRLGRVQE
jgi:tetratricopeptide (TPR) repeat protein